IESADRVLTTGKLREVHYGGKENPAALAHWTAFNGLLLAICLKGPNDMGIIGSAALVAPGVAFYVRHVLEVLLELDSARHCRKSLNRGPATDC
ncbi:MAG: hypothetical protein ACRETY_13205, partial [Steroidobacteraceae bacterium]